jgi:hypothetical protein
MNYITITYRLKLVWKIKGYSDYAFAEDKELYNIKRQKKVKKIYNNGSIGYILNGKFITLKNLKTLISKYENTSICPF